MARVPLIIHERIATWARQIRPRVASWPVKVSETRSAADLERALKGSACPLVVADLARWPRQGLDDLERALTPSANALVLVLDPGANAGLAALAREIGGTLVLSGPATPPQVVAVLSRWLPLAQARAEADGWSGEPEPEAEPWDLPAVRASEPLTP